MSDWIKVDSNQNETWDYNQEKEIEGTYVSKEENVGPNESNMYNFITPDGSTIGVWGNKMLDDRFKGISTGEEVKIVYLGKVKSEKTGREYHNFDVYHKPNESKQE